MKHKIIDFKIQKRIILFLIYIMKPNKSKSADLRYLIARELAWYFRYHLHEELKKPSSVSDYTTLEGIPFKKLTENMIDSLNKDFPGLPEKIPPFNFIKIWWERNYNVFRPDEKFIPYAESTFKLQNQIYMFRIADIRTGEGILRSKYTESMTTTIRALRKKGRNISFELVFNSENLMYPILLTILRRSSIPFRHAEKILAEQQAAMQKIAYQAIDKEFHDLFQRTDDILKSVLPENIADELKLNGKVTPKFLQNVSIMFCDLAGFTKIASTLSPEDLLKELDECFFHFDKLVKFHGLEKIKTIGDSYMAVSGLNNEKKLYSIDTILCGMRIQEFMRKYQKSQKRKGLPSWKVRIGIHTGPVVSGILGAKRFNFDIWGDAVNTAQRMEAYGEQDKVNISREVFEISKDFFEFENRGKLDVKGKGEMEMFFIKGIRPELSLNYLGKTPNREFNLKYKSYLL